MKCLIILNLLFVTMFFTSCSSVKLTEKAKTDELERLALTGTDDYTPPMIKEIKLKKDTIVAGEKGVFLFKALDDNSGLNLAETFTLGQFINDSGRGVSIYGSAPVPLGNDWYSIEFDVEKHMPTGDYELKTFWVQDMAGNQSNLESNDVVLKVVNNGQSDIDGLDFTAILLKNSFDFLVDSN